MAFFGYNHNNFHFSCCFGYFFSHALRELLGGNHGLCYAFVMPLLNGHFGTKDGQFGMKVDKLAEIWDLARLLPFLG